MGVRPMRCNVPVTLMGDDGFRRTELGTGHEGERMNKSGFKYRKVQGNCVHLFDSWMIEKINIVFILTLTFKKVTKGLRSTVCSHMI